LAVFHALVLARLCSLSPGVLLCLLTPNKDGNVRGVIFVCASDLLVFIASELCPSDTADRFVPLSASLMLYISDCDLLLLTRDLLVCSGKSVWMQRSSTVRALITQVVLLSVTACAGR
jgi:hypothetical protein